MWFFTWRDLLPMIGWKRLAVFAAIVAGVIGAVIALV